MQPTYQYTDQQALEDGVFIDVTPASCRTPVIVTAGVKTQFTMSAIMEMFNSFVAKFKDPVRNTHDKQNFYTHEKMNSEIVVVTTCMIKGKVYVKMYLPSER